MGKAAIFAFFAVLALSLITVLPGRSEGAGSPAPSPGPDCSSAILSLADCLDYVQVGGADKKPKGTCCSNFKKLLKSDQVSCLCEGFQSSASFGLTLNMTKAMGLPSACRVHAPPLSNCNITAAGTGAPAPSPAQLSGTGVPVGSPAGGVGGSATGVPTPAPVSTAAALHLPAVSLLVTMAAVAYACI